jgi:hypothetical protein
MAIRFHIQIRQENFLFQSSPVLLEPEPVLLVVTSIKDLYSISAKLIGAKLQMQRLGAGSQEQRYHLQEPAWLALRDWVPLQGVGSI